MKGGQLYPPGLYLPSRGGVSAARPARVGRAPLNSPAAPPRIGTFRQPQSNMSEVPFKTPASYEAALEELDQLVGLIESGQLPLEQLLTGYQRGAQLLQFCRDKLQAVENQIKVLDEGTLKPWTQGGSSICSPGVASGWIAWSARCPVG